MTHTDAYDDWHTGVEFDRETRTWRGFIKHNEMDKMHLTDASFDDKGEETRTDYHRMLKIVVQEHGYHGRLGIEYEGDGLGEEDGIRATLRLLVAVEGTFVLLLRRAR